MSKMIMSIPETEYLLILTMLYIGLISCFIVRYLEYTSHILHNVEQWDIGLQQWIIWANFDN